MYLYPKNMSYTLDPIIHYIPYLWLTYPTLQHDESQVILISKKSREISLLRDLKPFYSCNYIFIKNKYANHKWAASKHLQRVGLQDTCKAEYPLAKHGLQEHHLSFLSLLCKTPCRFVHLKRCMPIIPRLIQVETTRKSKIKFINKFY